MIAIGLLLAIAAPSGACHAVDGMRILGRHLAEADTAFAGIAPDVFVGYAPTPGVRRLFKAEELGRIAKLHGLTLSGAPELCFEWPMSVIEPERMTEAMRRNPELSEAKIEIVEFDRHPAPRGEIIFPPGGRVMSPLGDAKEGIVWRGYVKYDANRRFTIWARVKIAVASTRVVATHALPAGVPIQEGDLRMEEFQGFSNSRAGIMRVEEMIGQTPRRSIRAGEPIVRNLLEPPKDVRKGDSVEVTVADRNLKFRVDGYAETAGRRGETVLVRNLTSGKSFRARVDGPGKVTASELPPPREGISK